MKLTKTSGSDVIKLKGATTYAPAVVIAILTDAILRGRNRVTSVSTYLDGEYGFSDVCIGVPVVLGKNGVEKIIELELRPEVYQQFKHSVSLIKTSIHDLLKGDK